MHRVPHFNDDGGPFVTEIIRAGLPALLPRLRRFAVSLTGSASEADELVQRACERVLRRSDQLRDQTRMDAWIYGIMRNLWIDELRGRRVRQHDQIEAADDIPGPDGVAVVDGRLGLAEVRRALGSLPAEQRSVLVLICVDGLSYREAAEVLGIPVGTVMSRLSRGRVALHATLNGRPAKDTVTPFPARRVDCHS
ncbi:MAG: RNA polymerase sigma factor [Acetobacteraceae bacterium]